MGKRIGFWSLDKDSIFDYTLVTHESYEYYELFLEENLAKEYVSFKLRPSVKLNPEIFAWYLAISRIEEEFELDADCCNSSSGHLVSLLREFIQAFNNLNIETCQRLQTVFSRISFQNHYLYRTEWLLSELVSYSSIIREAFLETSPLDFSSTLSYNLWWNQPIRIQQCLNQFGIKCDLNLLGEIQTLQPLIDLQKRITKASGQWAALRGLEKLEAASGYFLALAEYWFKVKSYQTSLMYIHRSIDCALLLLGYRENQVIATPRGLKNDQNQFVKYSSTFKSLNQRTDRVFSLSEKNFIEGLNECRNHLRETHGFRVVTCQEVDSFLISACNFLQNLQPEVKSYSYKERFNINLQLPLKLIFEIESEIESYLEIT
jgi:hypothetical protein